MADAEDLLGAALGRDVRVRRDGNGVKAELHFDDLAELESLARRLRSGPDPRARIASPRAISSVG